MCTMSTAASALDLANLLQWLSTVHARVPNIRATLSWMTRWQVALA